MFGAGAATVGGGRIRGVELAFGFGADVAGDEPPAREGNFRTVCCATFDPDAPIMKCALGLRESSN